MPLLRILRFLDDEGVAYERISHAPAFSAQKIAAAAHVRGREMAKVVIVKVDEQLAMTVLPADCTLNLDHLRAVTDADVLGLATEAEFRDRFPDCEGGAMPPFGNLYGLPVFAASMLGLHEHVAFNAGNHREVIRMRYLDFVRLVRPRIVELTLSRV